MFSTNITKDRETSFDHPNLPAIVNPFNTHNKMAYNPGVKLSYYLGAKQCDLVHPTLTLTQASNPNNPRIDP